MTHSFEALREFGAPGQQLPLIKATPPGPESRSWQIRHRKASAPMGPRGPVAADGELLPASGIVLSAGLGANVECVDRNRYVDLAAGFGALLLGANHPYVLRALELQSQRLLLALGDVYPSDAKIGLLARLTELAPFADAQAILGQSGADAITCALKTAYLATGRPGVVAFRGAYHGLSYAPLAVTDLRASYRDSFSEQLSKHVTFAPYPTAEGALECALDEVKSALATGAGAVLVEPILGRGGVIVPPVSFLPELRRLCDAHGALLIADEIWTGLGRSGAFFASTVTGVIPDLICLGKGLGGGLPLSACVGPKSIMKTWSRDEEVVHTSTFAGAPLACATALATLDCLNRGGLVERAAQLGSELRAMLASALEGTRVQVRGAGMMLGLDLAASGFAGPALQKKLLEKGYLTSTGGGARDVLVLTPSLVIQRELLEGFCTELRRIFTD